MTLEAWLLQQALSRIQNNDQIVDDKALDDKAADDKGFVGSATTTVSISKSRQLREGIDWVLNTGSSWHICTNKELFINYEPYKPGTAVGWDSSSGQETIAEGHSDIILPIRKPGS